MESNMNIVQGTVSKLEIPVLWQQHCYNVTTITGEMVTEHTKAGRQRQVRCPDEWVLCTYSSWGSSRGLSGRVGSRVVHDVRSRTGADYLTPRQIHAHSSAAPSSVVVHAMRCHHSGHLWRAALRVKVAPSTVLAVQLRLWVRVSSSVGERYAVNQCSNWCQIKLIQII